MSLIKHEISIHTELNAAELLEFAEMVIASAGGDAEGRIPADEVGIDVLEEDDILRLRATYYVATGDDLEEV